MTLDTGQVRAIAAHLRSEQRPTRDADFTELEAYRRLGACLDETVGALAGPLGDERLIHILQSMRWHARGMGSVWWDIDMVAFTPQRMWWIANKDKQLGTPETFGYEQLTLTHKLISTGKVDRTATGLDVTVSKKSTTLEDLSRTRTSPPAGEWLAPILDRVTTREAPATGQWAADPTGRHQLRWWDETGWTSHVSDDGTRNTDSL